MTIDGSPPVSIHSEIAAKINFACHQSSFAFLRDLRIENGNEQDRVSDLLVTISSNPSFLKSKAWTIDRIAPGGSVSIKDRDIELDGAFLLDLTDAMRGTVTVTVEKDGEIIAEDSKPVEILAYNEWGGAGYMPELLAAFSVPNDPAVDRIIREASLVLRKAGKEDGIDGYKSGSRRRVWEITSAIYTAIANLGITYAVPPASFERDGQKIRLPGQILENRVSTCLDTSMLFVSALEQAGLNPIVSLPEGHALAGVWLQPEELTTIVVDEAETLRKRIQLKELALIETTFLTAAPSPPFSKAVDAAHNLIIQENDETFNAAIDIKRARAHQIMPLGLKTATDGQAGAAADNSSLELALEEAPILPDFDDEMGDEPLPQTPTGRLERWQRKLLDLTARNPLLNHKSTKTSLKIFCPDPGLLEDKLAEGTRISIRPIPDQPGQGQDTELHRMRTGDEILEGYARDALDRKEVLVDLEENELSKRCVEIYRKAQMALQEGGANTLYLALGFLLWKRDENDDRRFRAPLVLVPVTLERKSVRSGVKLLAHDDETRFNTTLLEMLGKDYDIRIPGLEGNLPEDESGVDVEGVWNTVRRAVRDVPGFEVVEDVVLGHFSFAKYLMWKDLVDRTEALRENAVVKHLLDTPRDSYPSEISFVEREQLDRDYKPTDLLVPLPADGSQMAAIATADRGKDFIIIGPPGTGKSQTISNLISHMLGTGRTVLFVSEKTAALDVVYRRLDEIGLGRFCLALHSNKARKADVLAQLRSAWEPMRLKKAEEWEKEAEHLLGLRNQLNHLVERLHIPRRNGMTVHHAIGIKVRDEALAKRVSFDWPSSDHHDQARLEAMREAVEKLRIQFQAVRQVAKNPFQLISKGDWSPQWEGQVVAQAGQLSSAASSCEEACCALLDAIGIEIPDQSLDRLDALAELATVLIDSYRKQTSLALEPDGTDRIEALEESVNRLKAYSKAQASLSCSYGAMAWRKLDGEEIARNWQAAENSWWPKSFFARRRVIKEMKAGGAQGKPNPLEDAKVLVTLRKEGEAIDRLDKTLSVYKNWEGHTTDPKVPLDLKNLAQKAQVAIGKLADDPSALTHTRGKVRSLMFDGNDLLAPDAAIGRKANSFLEANENLRAASDRFESIAGQPVRNIFSKKGKALSVIRRIADYIAAHHAELHDWCGWRRRRTEAIDLDLKPLVKAIEAGVVPAEELEDTFEAAYCTWWSGAVIGEDEVLRTFSTPEHNAAIEKFHQADNKFQELTAAYIAAKLSGELPDQDDVTRASSWGTLRRELQKKTRHKPVRQLVEEIPDVLTTLAPCLMMSPLSVAQYLPAEQDLFDVVIFDEASQITVWDAVGSLARGKQAIVAGDPKQMPPTNFFARADDDPDGDIDVEGDLESILDEMEGASIPQQTLNLHYRSRRESLIAFSNSHYYDNRLVTFPAPIHPDKGVQLVSPEGFYARGGARHNEGEAKAIVAEIVRRLTHEDEGVRNLSIGVVTFNSEQQSLIENLLDNARSKDPGIEWAFSANNLQEPVFVKNLETVQGDERDVILFSITYGPDQGNHVTMNFGPLNREGGERRLNVAMTRARSEMLVFSTLNPDRIDLSRSQAQAVADLKHFLEYAHRGPAALGAAVHGSIGDFDSPFEAAVSRALKDKGWAVHPQIGVSAYRIDLGVVHPDEPGIYLAGVECDGAMYHSSAFARERDKIRQGVLEGLGWTLFRVWSTDWWTNRAGALEKLDQSLRERLETSRKERAEALAAREAEQAEENDAHGEQNAALNAGVEDTAQESEAPGDSQVSSDVDVDTTAEAEVEASDSNDPNTYEVTQFDSDRFQPDPEAFYSSEYVSRIRAMIEHVIDAEGPIHETVLVRRIARHHGFQRAGRQIKEIVLKIAKRRRKKTQEKVGLFFWPEGTNEHSQAPSRFRERDDEMRNMDFICKQEICAIDETQSLDKDPVELARIIGISRLAQTTRERIVDALAGD
ncbi:MAG: DUF3320 domain-containing protein [Gammaproteobacteria bacterium]|nr:DUF3320 domain-containing protein [Gammaproteobacteria bacterium]